MSDDEGHFEIDGELRPLVSSGTYDLSFVESKTARIFNCDKLELRFKIITLGKYHGVILSRFYNVKIKGKPQVGGCFKPPLSGHFIREYARLFDLPRRIDRIPMSNFKNCIIKGKVETVTKGYDQSRIHKQLHYSVIRELVKVKEL